MLDEVAGTGSPLLTNYSSSRKVTDRLILTMRLGRLWSGGMDPALQSGPIHSIEITLAIRRLRTNLSLI